MTASGQEPDNTPRERDLERFAAGIAPRTASFRFLPGGACYCCGSGIMLSPLTRTADACPRCHPLWPHAPHRCPKPAEIPGEEG